MEFLHDLLPDSWFDDAIKHFGLTDDEVARSVHDASAFFNIDDPMIISEFRTTGVSTGLPFTENDDVLLFSRQQLQNMGITDKDGFDLVMTHEGSHRMLQAVSHTLSPHQEELCCDYMTGVRAGLNDMDITSVEHALAEQPEGSVHPIGSLRVEAINQGRQFAEQYIGEKGHAPTFEDCYEHFCESFPEHHFDAESYDSDDIKEYTQSEIDRHVAKAERDMQDAKSRIEYNANWIRKHGTGTIIHDAERGLRIAQHDYEHAKAEYNKWKYTHPDPKGFVETEMFSEFSNTINEDSDILHEYSSDVSNAASKVESCQRKVNSLYNQLQSAKSHYGTNSDEYRHVKSAYDKAQSTLNEAREDYKEAVRNAHRNGTL